MTTDPTPESVEALATMLHGVLNAPLPDDPADLDIVTWMQFRDRAREASARLAELEQETHAESTRAEVAEARADAAEARLREVRENVGMLYNSGVLKEEYHGPFAVVMALLNEETPART